MVKGKGKKKVAPRKPKTTALVPVAERPPAVIEKIRMPIVPEMSEAQIIRAFDILGITAKLKTDQQKQLFVAVAKEWKLNPLKRQIHAVAMGGDDDEGNSGTLVPVVGYEVYIERAEATGRLEYWDSIEEGTINQADWQKSDFSVMVVIKRRDQPREFHWKVRFVEAVAIKKSTQKPNRMWAKRPYFMTYKCAIGQAFRLCFREILLGMPFVDAEIDGQHDDETEPKPAIPTPQAVAGVEVQENGKITREEGNALKADVNAIAQQARELNAARSEVQAIFSRMAKKITTADNTEIMLYTVEELETMKQQAKAATSDIEKLRNYALDWTADYTSRLADKGFGG